MKKVICLIPFLLASASSVAATQDVRGFYLGAGAGSTTFEDDGWGASHLTSFEEKDNSFKFYTGYQFNKVIGIEAAYTSYGKIEAKKTNYTIDPTSISVSANVGYTFNSGLRPFGIVGLSAIDLNQSYEALDGDDGTAIHYGLGLEYSPNFAPGLNVRVAYEGDLFGIEEQRLFSNNRTYDVTVGSFYLGASYKF
ncbi:porin family protein [uncultured Photobacterium sp.]|uniref:porin family protein n=1 Tax=uncultured Photobacterium sp. TaxID=173973 RepID=UPI00263105A0|nr:porin family protein [uncultured Photobacterium sp.]